MPGRLGGKYKGKIDRIKGEATIAAELEAKRRRAEEKALARLNERRNAEALAARGLMSKKDLKDQEMKLKVAQMFSSGRKGRQRKFFRNFKIGVANSRKERELEERMLCWRRSCVKCGGPLECKDWWRQHHEVDPFRIDKGPNSELRKCDHCGIDTGAKSGGCRSWTLQRDPAFQMPYDVLKRHDRWQSKASSSDIFAQTAPSLWSFASGATGGDRSPPGTVTTMAMTASSSTPALGGTATSTAAVRTSSTGAAFAKTATSSRDSPEKLPYMPFTTQVPPTRPDLQEVTHWSTGQRCMVDPYSMEMWHVHVEPDSLTRTRRRPWIHQLAVATHS